MKTVCAGAVAPILFSTRPTVAQDAGEPPALTVSGLSAPASDYRLRGVSRTEKDAAVRRGIEISHDSGFYVGTWASNLSARGTSGRVHLIGELSCRI
jgi:uncharacterized protein (TIGR02001 family)